MPKTNEQCRFSLFCFFDPAFCVETGLQEGRNRASRRMSGDPDGIYLRYHLCEGKNISVFHERNRR